MTSATLFPCDTGSSAVMGDALDTGDERYRLWLERRLAAVDESPCVLACCLLNPSTADAERNDNTVTKMMALGRRWGFGRLIVVNMFGWRATDPRELLAAHLAGWPIIGPTDQYIRQAANESDLFVVGWGRLHPKLRWRESWVLGLLRGRLVHCLGRNQDESPRHPLYLPATTVPQLFVDERCR